MKVIFVASGNKAVGTVSSFVRTQFESLEKEGLDMVLFPVVGHGLSGYFKHFWSLRQLIRNEKPDVVHAHYSVCGYLASFASLGLKTKVVVSILGSFPSMTRKLRTVRFFVDHVWDAVIVKSERTKNQLGRDVAVIPNGVDIEKFKIVEKEDAKRSVGLDAAKRYVIFVSNPERKEKNFGLAEEAFEMLNEKKDIVLLPVFDKSHDEVVKYMCGADVLLMTSLKEGSPNVIKEAMACNCPIVVTDVGDVRWVTAGVDGTYVADTYEPKEIAELLEKALRFGKRTEGREQILRLGLTTEKVAQRILNIYLKAIDNHE